MIKGLYISTSSMVANQRRLNIVANNLANASTRGYKKEETVSQSFEEMLISRLEKGKKVKLGELGTGVRISESYTDFGQGKMEHTGNELDLAIQGNGFFVVETPSGTRYTRNGNFTVNRSGQVVTQDGYLVQGERGALQTIDGRTIQFDSTGQLYLGNLRADRIRVVNFPDKENLEKVGENLYLYSGDDEIEANGYQIKQGYLESSNVNIVKEMVKMIEVNRHYEANQRIISAIDSTLEKTVNSVGRVG